MVNILVVDDEPISADGISIYLQEHGESVWAVRTAYNGMQALEIARQRIDILVSDILMPGLDGFQIQERIQTLWPMCRCVFLTSVSQIDYAQRAVRSEYVTDYVLKAESEEKILNAVIKAIASQERAVQTQDILKKAEQEILKIRPLLQKDLIMSLLQGQYIPFSIEQRFREIDLPFQARRPVLLVLGQIGNEMKDNSSVDVSVFVLNNIAEKYLWPMYRIYTVSLSERRIAVLLQNTMSCDRQDVRRVFALMEAIQETFQKTGGAVSFAVNDVYCGWNELSSHYYSLIPVLERNLFMEDALILRSASDDRPECSPMEELHRVRGLLENGNYEEASYALQSINAPCTARGKIELYRKMLKLLMATIDLQEYADQQYESIHIPTLRMDENGWKSLQMEFGVIFRGLEKTGNTPSKRMEQMIEKVCAHVRQNLADDLSLACLAELVDHSPAYLSRVFKEVKGIGYNDFVFESRMERAKDLLQNEKQTLAEIAGQVGYTSSSYFIRTFRKRFGMTPTEYRNRSMAKDNNVKCE